MSIIKKLSDVLKEVFWLKSKSRRKSVIRKKVTSKSNKKIVKKKKVSSEVRLNRQDDKKRTEPKKSIKKIGVKVADKKEKRVTKEAQKRIDLLKNLVKVGEITHYFERIGVCVVKITHGSIIIGDKLTIVGDKASFVQKVWSMQIESQDVKIAKKGQLIGLKIDKPAKVTDIVYK